MIHRTYHKLPDFSHTRDSSHVWPDGPSRFLLCSILVRTCEVSFLRRLCWKQMMVARVDGRSFSHKGQDQIDAEDNVWRWVVTMIYDHDPWRWWWGHWVWHWPSATTAMIASEIQTSFNQVSSFKPTRFLALWFVNICDGSWWIIKLNRLGWEIDRISMKWLLQGASSLRQSPWCEDAVPVGATKRRKCWKNYTMHLCYTRLPSRGPNISHLGKRKFKRALGCWR